MKTKKILQIVPAIDIKADFSDGSGQNRQTVLLFALVQIGDNTEICGVVAGDVGFILAEDDDNFVGYVTKDSDEFYD